MSETQVRLADDPQMPTAGSVVGERYEIRGVLGEGGFAVVYRAFDTRTKADVAVKVLDPLMSRRREFASRFMREVETVSRLRHHNTITIFDAGETGSGCLYLVMELLDGEPLDVVLEREGALPAPRVRRIATQILKSLQEAHSKGIIHRDLKPGNVYLADVAGESDYVKVLDFGIAKSIDESQDTSLTATGQVMCSPHYVAPERIKEHVTVPASDLYSLGVMMVELLEGQPPYEGESPMMLAVKHLQPDPVPLGPATRGSRYGAVVERACAKNLEHRYESALDMLQALDACAAGSPATTSLPSTSSTDVTTPFQDATLALDDTEPVLRRGPHPMLFVLAALIVGGVAALFIVRSGTQEQTPPPVAAVEEPAAALAEPEAEPEPEPEPEPVPPAAPAAGPAVSQAATQVQLALLQSVVAQRQAADAAAAAAPEPEPEPRRRRARPDGRRAAPPPAAVTPPPTPEPVAAPEPEPAAAPEPAAEPQEVRRRAIRTDLAPR